MSGERYDFRATERPESAGSPEVLPPEKLALMEQIYDWEERFHERLTGLLIEVKSSAAQDQIVGELRGMVDELVLGRLRAGGVPESDWHAYLKNRFGRGER